MFSNNVDGSAFDVLSEDFINVTNVDAYTGEIIDNDFTDVDYLDYFRYFVIVSENIINYDFLLSWFYSIETDIDKKLVEEFGDGSYKDFTLENQKKFCEKLLYFLHERCYKKYDTYSTTIDNIYEKGRYNCVSSSIFYATFLIKYGIKFRAVETVDHVFIEIDFDSEEIDVETTNPYGFDPGNKKDVLDQFGKTTGFRYVPKRDYKNRNNINAKQLLFLVYHNLSNLYYKKKQTVKSANLSFLSYIGRNDEKGRDEFYVYFNNLIVDLSEKNDYKRAISNINSFKYYFKKEGYFDNMRLDLLGNYINSEKDYSKYEEIKDYILREYSRFDGADKKKFEEIYVFYLYNAVNFLINKQEYEKSFLLISEFLKDFYSKDVEKVFGNALAGITNNTLKSGDFETSEALLANLKRNFPQYNSIIENSRKALSLNKILVLSNSLDYEKALSFAKSIYEDYKRDRDYLNYLKNCYIKYAVYLFENRDIENLIFYNEEALKYFPKDSTLTNNYKAFFQNIIYEHINSGSYSEARKIVDISLARFPNESFFKKSDAVLKEKKY